MTTAPVSSTPSRYGVPTLPVRRFSVAEYHRLIADGYFHEDEPIELLEGWIVPKMPRNPPHDAYVAWVRRVIDRRLPAGWHVRVQSAITTPDSEPEPDLAVVRGEELDYVTRHPGPSDIALVAEVSESTLPADRGVMRRVYAGAGIAAYWVLNLKDRQVEVFTGPSGPAATPTYQESAVYTAGDGIGLMIEGADYGPVPVADLLR